MTKAEILKDVSTSHLKERVFFDTSVFYYLSGRYPDLSICRCVEIVEHLRNEIIARQKEEQGKDGTQV